MTNIQRGAFEKHVTKSSLKAIVCCTAADIKCPWKGPNDQFEQHVNTCVYEQLRPVIVEILLDNRQLKDLVQKMSEHCLKNHELHIKELQETNQCLNATVDRLNEMLREEKDRLKVLQNEVKQLKDLVLQNRLQLNELQIDSAHNENEVTRVDERFNKNEMKINYLTNKIDIKTDIIPYSNPQLEANIAKCQIRTTIDLSKQQLVDYDMEMIIKQAIIEKECKRLDLGYNVFTSIGASLLADALKHNTTLEELDFHNNRLSDFGVASLANVLSLNNSSLKALGLGSNNITDKGTEYLAEMLSTNQTITWLALAGNQIGDRGVYSITNALAHKNSSLLVLSLHVNKSISDTSVDVLINMLQHNGSLKKLWMQDCNISEGGKRKLREVAKLKQNFSLYM